jgi:hypothetical protein
MGKRENIAIGTKFWMLTYVADLPKVKNKGRRATFMCDCGTLKDIVIARVKEGHTKSCGCYRKQVMYNRQKTHGEAAIKNGCKTKEYNTWAGMIKRCNNPKDISYPHYGGKGITVCERWLHSYENFLEDMGRRPSPRHSIDRKDNNKGYTPNNCKWSTFSEQRRNNSMPLRYLTARGETKILSDWAIVAGIHEATLRGRLRRGWDIGRAIFHKIRITGRWYSPEMSHRIRIKPTQLS